jgi:hypothetical protein
VKIFYFFSGLFFIPFLIFASENESNLVWIENNLDSIFDSLEIAPYSNLEHAELEFGKISGEKFGFLKSQLIRYLDVHGLDDKAADSVLIRIEQFNIDIVYQQYASGFLGMGSEIVRKNTILLKGWLEKKAAPSVIRSLNVEKTFDQKLATDNTAQLEESPYSFTRGRMIELSLWKNVVEPVMVSVSVATLVYLFFSVRS